VNAAPEVRAEALPYLRVMFLFSTGMLVFFMLGGALRSAGDARTPMVLGIAMTVLNLVLNVVLIRGVGPIPAFGTTGAAMGTVIASGLIGVYALGKLWGGGWVVSFPRRRGFGPGLGDHPRPLPLRPAHRDPGDRDERRRRADARLHRLAGAERRRAGGLRGGLRAALLAGHLDGGGADGRRGGGGGAEPGRRPPRPRRRPRCTWPPASGWAGARRPGRLLPPPAAAAARPSSG
jgi:hypothetical protein